MPIKTWHGSDAVEGGKLVGSTDTDYFYFHCPTCGDSEVLRILDFKVIKDGPVEYNPELRKKEKRDFIIAFELLCNNCGFHDFTKVANIGWQGGKLKDTHVMQLARFGAEQDKKAG
ncbi:MAG: hypothetical protein Q8L86_12595 [Vicinamibacterales bacterium]|nr:hypothetical protein [Vicinamibacterales bacterium]